MDSDISLEQEMKWSLYFILPNINIQKPYENQFIAIVPYHDDRLQAIISRSAVHEKIVNGFIDDRNDKVEISALIIKDNAPPSVKSLGSIVDFRNAVALSIILNTWSLNNSLNVVGPLFSDCFDFYPMYFGRDDFTMIYTVAEEGYRSKNAPFIGMASRGVPRFETWPFDNDSNLLDHLNKVWEELYITNSGKHSLFTRRLFRSMQIAYIALSLPQKNQGLNQDSGINLSLWTSVLEILVNYGNKANTSKVFSLLNNYIWAAKKLRENNYNVTLKGKLHKTNLIKYIYNCIYLTRNDFMHGNKISKNIFRPFKNNRNVTLLILAPILCRVALCCYLLKKKKLFWGTEDSKEIRKLKKAYPYLNSTYESALLRIFEKPKKEDEY